MDINFARSFGVEQTSPEAFSSSKLIKAVRYVIYVVAFLLPLWFLPFTSDVLELDKMVLLIVGASVGLILFAVATIKSGLLRVRSNSLYLPFGVLIIAGIVSTFSSLNWYNSVFGIGVNRSFTLISIVAFSLLFFLAIQVIEDKGKFLKRIIAVSGVIALLFGVLQILGANIFSGGTFGVRSFYTVGSLHALAMFGAILLPWFLSLKGFSGIWRKVFVATMYIGIALAAFFLVLNNWWVTWTVAFVAMAAYCIFTLRSGHRGSKVKLLAVPVVIIVLGIVFMIFNPSIERLEQLRSVLPIEVTPGGGASLDIAVKAIQSRPLGFGLENFVFALDRFKADELTNNIFFQTRFVKLDCMIPALNQTCVSCGFIRVASAATDSTPWIFVLTLSRYDSGSSSPTPLTESAIMPSNTARDNS